MSRPRDDDRDPLRRILAAWSAGEGVDPGDAPHLVAVAREAVREADGLNFGLYEQLGAALAVRLYAKAIASPDALTVARALGECMRALRGLRLVGTTNRLRGASRRRKEGGSIFSAPRPRPRDLAAPEADEGEHDAGGSGDGEKGIGDGREAEPGGADAA